jgi:uncharacterized membrane protein (UPF0127 family)
VAEPTGNARFQPVPRLFERPGETVELRDATTSATIATEVETAATFWSRFRGLMLRGQLPAGHALLIRPGTSIHMMFMRFPIDAVFCDKEHRVTSVHHHVRPWIGLAMGGKGAKYVIELPSGAAANILPGHQMQLVEPLD